jgi:hypothetical protein
MSEYQLMSLLNLDAVPIGVDADASSDLLLFRKHFLVMNALYRLQSILWEEGVYLQISALHIALQSCPQPSSPLESSPPESNSEPRSGLPNQAGEQSIRDYYLDWREFEQADSASVEQLLDGFWQRYFNADKRLDALALFALDETCSWSEIRNAYRRQAALHHPDRGGDAEQFCRVRDAYELLASYQGAR